MADRFPLIVNAVSKKIEEIVAGDNLELTGNGIVVGGDSGAGKYLYSDGTVVSWNSPGDVYLNQTQIITNKTFETCIISGSVNTLTNIPNSALLNPGITINGSTVNLGGTISTPDTNTTYSISAADGAIASEKVIRLSAGGSGTGSDDITLIAGSNMTIQRTGDELTFISSYVDTDTITTLAAATGGTAQSGAITIAASGAASVSQNSGTKTITINATDTDTITRLRATTGSAYNSGDITFLASGSSTVSQGVDAGTGSPTITYDSTDTITRVKGGAVGSFQSGDITISGGLNTTVSQTGSNITIDSTDTNTITRVASGSNSVQSGDFVFTSSGATSISQSTVGGVTTINISSVNTDSGAAITASGGLIFSASDISLKNNANLVTNTLTKWDGGNNQLANSIITDDGSTVTIGGDLLVTGTQTVLEVSTLVVEDNIIELRKGNSIVGADGGIQINRTTDSAGNVTSYQRLEWFESGGQWRFNDGSVQKEIITASDTQTLSNKTLTSPIMSSPTLGAASATSINGLEITPTASAVLTFTDGKELEVKRDLVFTSDNNEAAITTNFRSGGNVAYTSDTLAVFNSTTSTQLRALINGTTGTDKLVFNTNPQIETGFITASSSLTLFNTAATDVTLFGAATTITMGAAGGTTDLNQSLHVFEDIEIGVDSGGAVTDGDLLVHGIANFDKKDILIRGTSGDPLSIGRGGGSVSTNTRVGVSALDNNSSGSQNTALGYRALLATNSGASNTGIGYRALNQTGNGQKNVAVGADAMLDNTSGQKNVAVGKSSLENNQAGVGNVCIGHYAGWGVTGTGNVLIGPADDENSTNATHTPDDPSGDRQLVIGSGTGTWIKGDSNFAITIPNNFTVEGDTVVQGQLTVNGTLTSINSNIIQIDDKNLELAAVVNTTFDAVTLDGSNIISAINPTANLIPGMEVTSTTGGISVPVGTLITTITGNQAELSNSVSGTGTASFTATGPSDTSANGGGVIVKGTTNHSILYDNRTDKFFTSTDNFELAFGKSYYINNQLALSTTTLGSTVVNSSLTSVGVLVGPSGSPALEVDGAAVLGGRVIEKVFSSFSSNFVLAGNTLNITTAAANTICGTTPTTAINTWAFTTADPDGNTLQNGQSITVTVIIDANTAASYGDACTVDGNSIVSGVQWAGGSPPLATSNTDILSFIIIKDNSGVVRVYGQGNTDFS